MQTLRNTNRSDGRKDLFSQIESPPTITQNGWDDITVSTKNQIALIDKANKSINLIEYLESRTVIEYVNSSSTWNYRMRCPFHKHGDERTASFYATKQENRFYCQACGKTGGIVEYIAYTYNRPLISVAEHILKCLSGDYVIDTTAIKKAAERKKYQTNMLILSDMYRNFIHQYIDDEDAINYINKCFSVMDSLFESNSEKMEESIEQIVKQFDTYIKKYK